MIQEEKREGGREGEREEKLGKGWKREEGKRKQARRRRMEERSEGGERSREGGNWEGVLFTDLSYLVSEGYNTECSLCAIHMISL